MKTAGARPFIASRLGDCPALDDIPIMQELPRGATPDEIAAEEKTYEDHLATKGLVLILLRPVRSGVAGVASSVSIGAMVPIAISENPEVNRRAPGLQLDVEELTDEIIAACLCDRVTFAQSPDTPPARIDGLVISYVQPIVKCLVRSSGNTAPEWRPNP